MVIALAGRRVDAPDSDTERFPLENVPRVRQRIGEKLKEHQATALICSAAAGADLLALDVAGELRLRRRIILPYSREQFRESSVVDRPGDWAQLYGRICSEVDRQGDLVILQTGAEGEANYLLTNQAILDQAMMLAADEQRSKPPEVEAKLLAVIVWEGTSRGTDDVTAAFANQARRRDMNVEEVLTR